MISRQRRQPARQRAPLARTGRVGRASAARRKAGGPRVKGRAAVSVAAWRAIVLDLTTRCRSICEVPWCRQLAALQPHHVKPCSLGGADDACNILMVCDTCHKRFDYAFVQGKHTAEALGGERYTISLEYRKSKRMPLCIGSLHEFYMRPDGTF